VVVVVLVAAGLAPLEPDPITPEWDAPVPKPDAAGLELVDAPGPLEGVEGLVEVERTVVAPAGLEVTPAVGVADPPLLGVVVLPAAGLDAGGVVGMSPGSSPPARRETRLLTPTRSGFTSGSSKPDPGAGVDPDPPDTWGGSMSPLEAPVEPNPLVVGIEVVPPAEPPNG
jgi:hypothetical protein